MNLVKRYQKANSVFISFLIVYSKQIKNNYKSKDFVDVMPALKTAEYLCKYI